MILLNAALRQCGVVAALFVVACGEGPAQPAADSGGSSTAADTASTSTAGEGTGISATSVATGDSSTAVDDSESSTATDGGTDGGRHAIPQYLVFQLFIYGAPPDGNIPPPALNHPILASQIDEILVAVNQQTGDGVERQLGFAVGPITFDHTDDQVREIIQGGFALAEEKGVAVVFHFDNSLFWIRRSDLWSVTDNVEWTDWNGTPAPGQMIGWLPGATLAPPMCWNSPTLQQEVGRILRDVIGAEISLGLDHLASVDKTQLYGGVIAGWETFLAPDAGYCGLTNAGYSAANPPSDVDEARAWLTHDWAEFYTGELVAAGVPQEQLYTHAPGPVESPVTALIGAPPWTAFNDNSLAGFSTYDFEMNSPDLFALLARNGNPRWASAEGTNYNLAGPASMLTMEQYLGGMLSHNVGIITVFAWGDPSPIGDATTSDEAKAAYLKFVTGEPLQE